MAQGWDVDAGSDTITFYEAPTNGATIVVNEYAQSSYNATDIWSYGAWSTEFGYPREVEFFSDRLIFAGTVSDPQTLWFSQTGDYTNFGRSTPLIDSDSITATINSRRVNQITDLVGLEDLLIMTAGVEWKLDTGQTQVVAPDTIAFRPQSYNGSDSVPALTIDKSAIYLQKRSQAVRDLNSEDSYTGQYGGRDITAFSNHLLEGHEIIEWAYQKHPFSTVWAIRDDGTLLCLTYMREHEVVGWTRCETNGVVESLCVIPEGEEDAVYMVVKRTAPGAVDQERRFIERLSPRRFTDIREATFLDSYLVYDGRVSGENLSIVPALVNAGDTAVITAGSNHFTVNSIGSYIVLYYNTYANNGLGVRCLITGYNSPTSVDVVMENPLPAGFDGSQCDDWGIAPQEVQTPQHLVGATFTIFGDGAVYDDQTPGAGQNIVMDPPAVVVCVGLRYESDMETLEINAPGAETLFTKNKLIKEMGLLVKDTRSVRLGPDFDNLDEIDAKQTQVYGLPDTLDGVYQLSIRSGWAERGRVCIRQSDPLPITILGIILDFKEGK